MGGSSMKPAIVNFFYFYTFFGKRPGAQNIRKTPAPLKTSPLSCAGAIEDFPIELRRPLVVPMASAWKEFPGCITKL